MSVESFINIIKFKGPFKVFISSRYKIMVFKIAIDPCFICTHSNPDFIIMDFSLTKMKVKKSRIILIC